MPAEDRVVAPPSLLNPEVYDCGESAILVDFGAGYSKSISLAILQISERLHGSHLEGYRESIPAVTSLTISYDPLVLSKERLVAAIESACATPLGTGAASRLWIIPCVYGGASGPDLGDIARAARLSETEAAGLHASETYVVSMLGFLPGFAYLVELPERLRVPRRATPRARIPAGSIAIAADMTAIYPLESPGGWHLIGWTPVPMWDMARRDEPLLRPGDRVRFRAIDAGESETLRARVAEGWMPKPEDVA
ncbi:5-oxoprolinase subunit PxpB [Rhodomicrobium sp. Az07]|uniref:5-oxoprolinase subunit PxpB n=1 Tax=Rhodomicrobium sp. Az07 TaxID=2839034 RepID=UPI001BE8568B|nr:5-oxoprolinase subunit PxpB [Rhodomicrobium sp. Az07]MBT3070800.1 5-oxoprolinase subunit PxpB [Rhodomicrobium sp. Az07]